MTNEAKMILWLTVVTCFVLPAIALIVHLLAR